MPYSVAKRNMFLNLTFPTSTTSMSYTTPSKVYLALSSNNPVADGGTFTEISKGNYERIILSRQGQDLPDLLSAVNNGKIYNKKQITFNRATEDYTVNGIAVFEVPTGGTPTFYAALKNPVDVAVNQIFTFDPNTFVIQFSDTDVEIVAEASAE